MHANKIKMNENIAKHGKVYGLYQNTRTDSKRDNNQNRKEIHTLICL